MSPASYQTALPRSKLLPDAAKGIDNPAPHLSPVGNYFMIKGLRVLKINFNLSSVNIRKLKFRSHDLSMYPNCM